MKKILVVNNDFDTMSLLQRWLEKKNYQVRFTSSKDEVIKIMESFKPEILLVDVLHSDIIHSLKAKEESRVVPIVLMTGYTSRRIGGQLPVEDVIEKPFNLAVLEKKIETLLKKIA
jgi:DNA-binding response OmpR family regulator